jgi:PEP-CTERM motif
MFRKTLPVVIFVVIGLSFAQAHPSALIKYKSEYRSAGAAIGSGGVFYSPVGFYNPSSPDNWLGGDGPWNGSNWSNGYPGQNSDVIIDTGNDFVYLNDGDYINSLTIGGSSGSSTLYNLDGTDYHVVSITGALTINQSGSIILGDATTVTGALISAGADSSNAGSISIGNASEIEVGGTFANSGYIELVGSSSTVEASNFVNYGQFIVNNDPQGAQSVLAVNGSLTNTGIIEGENGAMIIDAENLSNSGEIYTSGTGGSQISVGRFTNNATGYFALAGIGDIATIANMVNLGQIAVGNGATLTVPIGASASGSALAGFLNAGVVNIQQGGEISSYGGYTQNTGQTTVDGTLAGIIKLNGGTVYGNGGTMSGSVTSNASINFGDAPLTVGQLAFAGNYTQGANGSLTFDIASQSQYDRMSVTGQAHLNGMMTVDLLQGYIPQVGNMFEIMTFGGESGTFSNVVGLPIDNQEHFLLEYNSTNLTLDVVAGQLAGITSVKLGSGNSVGYEPFIETASPGTGYQLAGSELPSQTTPEPGTLLLGCTGLAGLIGLRRRSQPLP